MENKTMKITPPEGYEIDRKKSTFEEIVFKKIVKVADDVVIKWMDERKSVLIKADGMSFYIDASHPTYQLSWYDAQNYSGFNNIWILPRVQQLKVISKYFEKINEVIKENNGYELERSWYWSSEESSEEEDDAVIVYMGSELTDDFRKHSKYYVCPVSLIL